MITRKFGAAIVASIAVGTSTHAALVQIRDAPGGEHANGNPNGPLLPGTGSNVNGSFSNGSNGAMYMGTWSLEADYGSGFGPLITYCIEPNQNISFGFHPTDTVGATYTTESLVDAGFTPTEAGYMGILWANAFADSQTSAVKSAAFQSVLWEFSEDNTINLLSGNFRLNAATQPADAVYALAQSWINNIIGGQWTSSVELIALTSPNSQDFITTVIPAPGALALLALAGLAGRPGRRR